MQFCDNCENLLIDKYTTSTFSFECAKCKRVIEPKPQDTLREYISFDKSSYAKYSTIIKNAPFDKTNPRRYGKCKKCVNTVMSYVILGDDAKHTQVCLCGEKTKAAQITKNYEH